MRFFVGFVVGGFLGCAGGVAIMLIVFPFLFPPPMVNETVDDDFETVQISEVAFRQNVSGHDLVHWGRGDVKIYSKPDGNYVIELQANFEVGPGPNFWIYANSEAVIDNENDFNADIKRVRLTKLKSFQGSQVYEVDASKLKDLQAITIWCESFGQYIASADISINQG